jgi:hypothetical protein
MALNTGFENLVAASSTFSDWLQRTNEMSTMMRNTVLTANTDCPNTTGNARLIGRFQANTISVADSIQGGIIHESDGTLTSAILHVTSNTTFENDCLEVKVNKDLIVSSNLHFDSTNTGFSNTVANTHNTFYIGNTTVEWAGGHFVNMDITNTAQVANLNVTDLAVILDLNVTNTANTANLNVSDLAVTLDLNVTDTANTSNLNVSDTAGIVNLGVTGNAVVRDLIFPDGAIFTANATVGVGTATTIDHFPKTNSKGFKYIIQGNNAEDDSVFTLELMCGHNNTNIFFTRYGELTNDFNAVITPSINNANVELSVVCSGATGSNTHSFNIVRIETR